MTMDMVRDILDAQIADLKAQIAAMDRDALMAQIKRTALEAMERVKDQDPYHLTRTMDGMVPWFPWKAMPIPKHKE